MYILFAAILALLLYFIQFRIYKNKWKKNLYADAYFKADEAFAGDEAELTETIENRKGLPLPMVKMKLQLSRKLLFREMENSRVSDFFNRTDIYSIKPYEKVTRTIKFICKERGYYDFNGIDLLSTDLFYSTEFVKAYDSASHLYVYPKPYDREALKPVLTKINGEVITKNNIIEDPFELKGIREYQTYDSLRNINWKASAKTDDLMVNMHDYTAKRTIRIFLNFENNTVLKRDELMELSISMAVSSIIFFCSENIPVSIYANSKDILSDSFIKIDEGSGESHIRTANRAFARIDLSKAAYSFSEIFKEDLLNCDEEAYTIIISPYMQEDFQKLLLRMKSKGLDFTWLCPEYKSNPFEAKEDLRDNFVSIKAEEALYEYEVSLS